MVMRFAIGAVVAAFCLIAATSSSDARGPYGSINVGNWKGGAYTIDQTGAFSHCAAGASYASGVNFLVTIDGTGAGSSALHTNNGSSGRASFSADPDL